MRGLAVARNAQREDSRRGHARAFSGKGMPCSGPGDISSAARSSARRVGWAREPWSSSPLVSNNNVKFDLRPHYRGVALAARSCVNTTSR